MSERKGYTDEQKAAIKARRDERNAAVKALIELVLKTKEADLNEDVLVDMKELATIAKPKSNAGTGQSRRAIKDAVAELFEENSEVDELTIFQDLHMGRKEMATAIKNIIKNAKPEDRKWIRFDVDNGMYVLEGLGAEAPEGWTGYVPVEEVSTEDVDEDEIDEE